MLKSQLWILSATNLVDVNSIWESPDSAFKILNFTEHRYDTVFIDG